jgi:predicted transcriptional regulator YdeE
MEENPLRELIMQPTIVHKDEIMLVGISFYGDPFETSAGWTEENQIGRLWQRLMGYLAENGDAIEPRVAAEVSYEVHVYGPETLTKGLFEVFVGIPVSRLEAVPIDLLVKILPAAQYAVFTFQGKQISSDWHLEIDQWIAKAGYRQALPFSFQYYDERFKGIDHIEESELDVYMPVMPLTPNP